MTAHRALRVSRQRSSASRPAAFVTDPRPLHPAKLHSLYGDEFDGGAPDGAWATVGTAPSTALAIEGSSWNGFGWSTIAKGGYAKAAPAGDFTLQGRMAITGSAGSVMIGMFVEDASRNGFCVCPYDSPDAMVFVGYSAGDYNGSFLQGPSRGVGFQQLGIPFEAQIIKSGTSFNAKVSQDGKTWSANIGAGFTSAMTVAKIGFGCVYSGGGGARTMRVDYVDVQ